MISLASVPIWMSIVPDAVLRRLTPLNSVELARRVDLEDQRLELGVQGEAVTVVEGAVRRRDRQLAHASQAGVGLVERALGGLNEADPVLARSSRLGERLELGPHPLGDTETRRSSEAEEMRRPEASRW